LKNDVQNLNTANQNLKNDVQNLNAANQNLKDYVQDLNTANQKRLDSFVEMYNNLLTEFNKRSNELDAYHQVYGKF
jgi:hypothetical protein